MSRSRKAPGVTLDRGRYYWVKRVPKHLDGLILGADGLPVRFVRIALQTDSLAEANAKASKVAESVAAEWAAIQAGRAGDARAHYLAARRLAEARGFAYLPIETIAGAATPPEERVRRVDAAHADIAAADAVGAILGAVPAAMPRMAELWPEVQVLTEAEHRLKSDAQKEKWRNPRERALQEWADITGDPPIDRITRADALKFRRWWSDRITAGGLTSQYANKMIGHLSAIFATYAKAHDLEIENPFRGLSLKGETENRRPPFSLSWVRDRLLAPGALDGLNDEARDVLLVMVNTGARPSEITDSPGSDWRVKHAIPHLVIAPHGRELKVGHTAREVPLLGVSLQAAERIAKAGGCTRYRDRAGTWSALVNKYLRNNGLAETPRHTAYSVRHYVEDRLLMTGADDRVRADILGHDYKRPSYGEGGALEGRRIALERVAL